jgi:Ca-activated chloride channel family protein
LSDDQPESSEQALTLALHYQLVTSQTSLFLVHVRAEGEKATGLPGLEQIAQMQAAGWGGAGSVMPDEHAALMFRRRQSAGTQFSSLASASHISFSMKEVRSINENVASINPYFAGGGAEGDQFFDVPTFLRKSDEPVARVGDSSPVSLLEIIDATAQLPDADQSWVERLDALGVPRELVRLVDEMADSLGTREQAWGVVLHWLAIALAGDFALSRLGARIVRYSIRAVDPGTLAQSLQALTQALGPVQANAWISVSAGA